MQMYKLFYNEAVLSIKRHEHITSTETISENCLVYSSISDFKAVFFSFLHNELSVTIICQTDDEENNLWKEIKNYFIFRRAAGGIVFKRNAILSIYRLGQWDFPKGHVEKGETDIQTAIREVMEETDIDEVSLCKDLGYTHHIFSLDDNFVLKETHWFEMQTTSNQTLIPQSEESIEKAEWIPLNRLHRITSNMYPSLVDFLHRNELI
jgi:8-oxo-dGTP pyrophosphatase MutT (NUDIX family)